ncbi:MAG: aminoacyl-tRNA hydrolase [bacterium]
MKIIAGLGNPGEKYKNTRHNIGFMATEALASGHNIKGTFSTKFNAIIGKGMINKEEVIIVQPLTYMNLSGEAVSKIMNWYKVDLADLFVVFDDVSLDIGKIRLREEGSAGSHNGIKSIISCCGGQKFPRLKIGIGPNPGEHLWASYVLEKFTDEESKILKKIIPLSVEAMEDYLLMGINFAQNKYNGISVI